MIKLIIALTFLSVSLEAVDFTEYRANKKIKKNSRKKNTLMQLSH